MKLGQQVTGYKFNDTNNIWKVLPGIPTAIHDTESIPVQNGDLIRLLHVNSDTVLLTHDVASPSMPTNEEFTTDEFDDENSKTAITDPGLRVSKRHNETVFQLTFTRRVKRLD